MAPPLEPFPSSDLPKKLPYSATGKYLKPQPGPLSECKLLELVQYNCDLAEKDNPNAVVICEAVVRLFRR
ncbi:hypothetical protein M501DRAFT_1002564 [Patellaria atrata CBS 101060]|uniref:Uncharacterized protein n=1 Tax=Patellaria atrata CBS 101060 TaxID=1346257 RepID=A0A9P4SD31_9PEZI|nr:hypothetical protein M501DRAFT_1002564 [Patellaria atrata CBS 101060]